MKKKIKDTPFGHFLEFNRKIKVESSILDDTYRSWVGEDKFCFRTSLGTKMQFTSAEVGRILHVP